MSQQSIFPLTIQEKNLHLVEKRDVFSYSLQEFNAMDEERQLETLWLQMDACLEEIAKERSPRKIDIDAALQTTMEYFALKSSCDASSNHC